MNEKKKPVTIRIDVDLLIPDEWNEYDIAKYLDGRGLNFWADGVVWEDKRVSFNYPTFKELDIDVILTATDK